MALNVRRAGVLTTVQDLGRHGYQRHGVPVAGAMDAYALRVANTIVGNEPLFVTKISDNPYMTLTKAKVIASNYDLAVNF